MTAYDVRKATEWDVAVAAELRRAREERGRSQAYVCERVDGLNGTTLGVIERGLQRVSIGMIVEICAAINVPVETVLNRAGIAMQAVKSQPTLQETIDQLALHSEELAGSQGLSTIRTVIDLVRDLPKGSGAARPSDGERDGASDGSSDGTNDGTAQQDG